MSPHILVVEDEADLADALAFALEREGFRATVAHDGKSALAAIAATPPPDLVLLDLMLPDMSGTEVCRTLRAHPTAKHIPVIMVTARTEEIDRVVGFEVGADDYVAKPYSSRELVLRVRAVLRRREAASATTTTPTDAAGPVRFGLLAVDKDAHKVWVADREVPLTALEQRLIQTFLDRKGRVQSRETLLADVWGITADITTRTVDTHVKRLREKLGDAGAYIETVRGAGYRFRAHPDDVSHAGT
jgi:two-component system, OmpR family, phosphate regulon response regulator PhoB